MSPLIKRNCFGIVVGQEEKDGYINITKLCKAYTEKTGKRKNPNDWLKTDRTKESINHLNSVTNIPVSHSG